MGIEVLVDKVIVTDDLGKEFWKPHKKSYINMMNYFKINKDECIYIGDNPNKDFIGAKEIGMMTVRIVREKGDHIKTHRAKEYEADLNIVTLLS